MMLVRAAAGLYKAGRGGRVGMPGVQAPAIARRALSDNDVCVNPMTMAYEGI